VFEIAPEVRPLFRGDMDEQGRMFVATLTLAVNGLDAFHSLEPALCELAIRHAGCGVKAEHYQPFGAALVWVVEQSRGDDFAEQARSTSLAVYDALSGVMIEAAYRTGSAD
jgi:nitric oxide dioxygenase